MTDLKTPENLREDEVVGEEELVPADDAIIGKAFRWSLLVFLILGCGIGGMVWLLNRPEVVVAQPARAFVPPKVIDVPAAAPVVGFTDITAEAGIDFVHANGARGEKLLPETMGGGCAFLDFDNDGDQDILLVNSNESLPSPPTPLPEGERSRATHALYRNDGSGKFENVTVGSGLDVSSYGMGVACGDYDNDGDVDVFITDVGPDLLFENKGGGKFQDVTAAAGVGGDEDGWSTSAGLFDYDNDGDLDLFVCNYVKWSKGIDFAVNYTLTGVGRAYGPPTNFEGAQCSLFRNEGQGVNGTTRFIDVSEPAGIHVKTIVGKPMGKALGLVFADVDRDGFMDVFVANDTVQRFFFHNQKDGTFKERAAEYGLAFDRAGNATGAMGVDCGQYRNDAALGFVIGNFANEMSSLLVSQGTPGNTTQFSDEAITEGIGSPTRLKLTFGAFFFDYDLDGRLDLLHANGHIEDQINLVQSSQQYKQSAQLFWNAGPEARACFVEAGAEALGDLPKEIVGRGAAYADIDGDGDLDVLLTQVAGKPMLLRNDLERAAHWLRLKLVGDGVKCNRDAIGARVELTAGGITQSRVVAPTRSYLSQVEMVLTFGLGENQAFDSFAVVWPDGSIQPIQPPMVDRMSVIGQGASR